jgi:excisionase family DNA binding protein
MQEGSPVYTVKEIVARLEGKLSRGAVYEGIERGEIPSIRIGKRILIPKAPFDRLFSGEL